MQLDNRNNINNIFNNAKSSNISSNKTTIIDIELDILVTTITKKIIIVRRKLA